MKKLGILLTCLLTLGLLSPALTKPITPAPDTKDSKASPKRIESLVKQLGAARIADRDEAQKELEAIGSPALEFLRKTVKEAEPEVSNRAAEIVRRLEDKALASSVLAPKKVKLSLKDVSVLDALAELTRQSGYAIQVDGNRSPLASRKITLETGEVSFFEALDQLCAKGGLVEKSPNGVTVAPNLIPKPIVRPGIRQPIQPVPVPRAAPPAGGLQIQGGILPPKAPIPEPAKKTVEEQKKALQEQIKKLDEQKKLLEEQLKKLQSAVPQGGNQALPPQGQNAGVDLKQMTKMLEEHLKNLQKNGGLPVGADVEQIKKALDEQFKNLPQGGGIQIVPQAQLPKIQADIAQMKKAMDVQLQAQMQLQIQIQPALPPVPGLPLQPTIRRPIYLAPHQIIVADGKPLNVPTSYSGAARIRLLPPASVNMQAQPGELLLIFEISAEPRLQVFYPHGTPAITRAKDDQGQVLNVVEEAQIQPIHTMLARQRIFPVRLKLGDKKAETLKELTGTMTVEVDLPPEAVVTIDNVLQAKGQTVKGKKNAVLTLESIEKSANGYNVEFTVETLQNQAGAGGAAAGGVQVQVQPGVGLVRPIGLGINQTTPNLLDADGKNYQVLQMRLMKAAAKNGVYRRTYAAEYRPNAGQGQPVRLVLSEPRTTNIAVPFEFKNVKLP